VGRPVESPGQSSLLGQSRPPYRTPHGPRWRGGSRRRDQGGSTRSMTGATSPRAIRRPTSRKSCRFPIGVPRMRRCRWYTDLMSMSGSAPEVAPQITIRPPGSEAIDGLLPRLLADVVCDEVHAAAIREFDYTIVEGNVGLVDYRGGPLLCFSAFQSAEVVAYTSAPIRSASWRAAWPTPPLAPRISAVSLGSNPTADQHPPRGREGGGPRRSRLHGNTPRGLAQDYSQEPRRTPPARPESHSRTSGRWGTWSARHVRRTHTPHSSRGDRRSPYRPASGPGHRRRRRRRRRQSRFGAFGELVLNLGARFEQNVRVLERTRPHLQRDFLRSRLRSWISRISGTSSGAPLSVM